MKCIVNLFSDPQVKFEKRVHNENYSGLYAEVASNWGSEKLGFNISTLDPDTFSCPYHLHHQEEELFIAIEGSAVLRQGDEFFKIKEGDLIFFKLGVAHQFYNNTDKAFKYLALSNKDKNDVCEYPDSQKKLIRQDRKLTQNGVEVDYWKDEDNPRAKWPAEILKR